jgi:hypothetical protein
MVEDDGVFIITVEKERNNIIKVLISCENYQK